MYRIGRMKVVIFVFGGVAYLGFCKAVRRIDSDNGLIFWVHED